MRGTYEASSVFSRIQEEAASCMWLSARLAALVADFFEIYMLQIYTPQQHGTAMKSAVLPLKVP